MILNVKKNFKDPLTVEKLNIFNIMQQCALQYDNY